MSFNRLLLSMLLLMPLSALAQSPSTKPADGFTDPETGTRIIRLSRYTDDPSGVIYFHQPCITADGKYALVRTLSPADGHTAGFIYRYDFAAQTAEKITERVTRNQVLSPKSGNMYFASDKDRTIYVSNIYTKETRKLAEMPEDLLCWGGLTVNCDETLVVGVAGHPSPTTQPTPSGPPNRGPVFNDTFERHDLNILFAFDLKTGEYRELHRINTWLGHTQFSPTDPKLLMFCHEGPWQKVDRIWTIRIEPNAQPELVYKREVPSEIAGHEFWSADGKTVWFDNNYRDGSGRHFLKGKNIETGAITTYPITEEFGSIHYTPSPDGKFFIADGGTRKGHPERQGMFILVPKDGQLVATKLCSMAKNDYAAAEPNPHITPDQRWVIFTATLTGKPQAWAVETPKQFWRD